MKPIFATAPYLTASSFMRPQLGFLLLTRFVRTDNHFAVCGARHERGHAKLDDAPPVAAREPAVPSGGGTTSLLLISSE